MVKLFMNGEEYKKVNEFSNVYESPFTVIAFRPLLNKSISFQSVEHFIGYCKFCLTDSEYSRLVLSTKFPELAKAISEKGENPIPEWNLIKDDIMRIALLLKFSQNPDLEKLLLRSGRMSIVENGEDSYWGRGKDGFGKNILGKLLSEVRSILRQQIDLEFSELPAELQNFNPVQTYLEVSRCRIRETLSEYILFN